jgi:choice-of-anchor A domain-containing protein
MSDSNLKRTAMLALAVLCGSPLHAHAQTDLGVAGGFNAFIFGNVTTPNGGESEGPLAIGGNWTTGSYNVNIGNHATSIGSTSNIGAYVLGNVTGSGSTQINNGANAYVGGTVSGNPLIFNGGGSLKNGSSFVSSSAFNQAAYSKQSNYLASLSDQVINTSDPNNLHIDLNTATKYGNFKVFSISASQLAANRTLDISNFSAADTLLIDITGGDVNDFGLQITGGNFDRILFNDNTAANFTVDNRLLEGSLLAPLAAVTQKNVIEGNLIAASLTVPNGNELHFGPGKKFDGTLLSETAAVPEPGTVALLVGMGLSWAGFLARRKTARKAA